MASFFTDSLIVANPCVAEVPKFSSMANRAVYIIDHSDAGAIGVSLNKNFTKSIREISLQYPILKQLNPELLFSEKVIAGGPVMDDRPWIFSRNPNQYDQRISNDWLSLNFSDQAFLEHQPQYFAACGIGTFGWGKGQLENEMACSLWHHFPTCQTALDSIPFGSDIEGAVELLSVMKYFHG